MFHANRLRITLGLMLAITLTLKLFLATSVLKPTNEQLSLALYEALASLGYSIAGPTSFAARDAIMADKNGCITFFVPVSEHGWHQEAVRAALSGGQKLSFLYSGSIYENQQPRWRPLLEFYFGMALNYTGFTWGYNSVYAVVYPSTCNLPAEGWSDVERVPYRRLSIAAGYSEDY